LLAPELVDPGLIVHGEGRHERRGQERLAGWVFGALQATRAFSQLDFMANMMMVFLADFARTPPEILKRLPITCLRGPQYTAAMPAKRRQVKQEEDPAVKKEVKEEEMPAKRRQVKQEEDSAVKKEAREEDHMGVVIKFEQVKKDSEDSKPRPGSRKKAKVDKAPQHPSESECYAAWRGLCELHGQPVREQAPCLDVTSHSGVLDSLVRTILSQNTTDDTSRRAFNSLKACLPTWQQVLDAEPEVVEEAIRVGGLAEIKTVRIKKILQTLLDEDKRGPDGGPSMEYALSLSVFMFALN
jgi:hypothetical protein